MLNMLAPELAPIVHAIFTQSLDTGELPRDWSLAIVAPIFKKGNRVLAENYGPMSFQWRLMDISREYLIYDEQSPFSQSAIDQVL